MIEVDDSSKDPCAAPPVVQTLYIEQPVYREPTYEKERLFKEKDIKALEPFGAVFRKDVHYKDEGLQPPDPFKEHPIDRDVCTESPDKSEPDDPKEKPVPSLPPGTCEELVPADEPCDEETPTGECDEEPSPEDEPKLTDSGSLCITADDPFPDTGDDPFPEYVSPTMGIPDADHEEIAEVAEEDTPEGAPEADPPAEGGPVEGEPAAAEGEAEAEPPAEGEPVAEGEAVAEAEAPAAEAEVTEEPKEESAAEAAAAEGEGEQAPEGETEAAEPEA